MLTAGFTATVNGDMQVGAVAETISRSTRRSSTSAASGGSPAHRSRSGPGCGARSLADVGLAITVGVARTKFLAKVASGVAKPDGLLVVEPDGELAFLHPLPVERLWGVGPATAEKLHARGISNVGEVAALGEGPLVAILGGGVGRHLHALAHNRDPRPVVVGRRRRSVGSQRAMGRGPHSAESIDAAVVALVDRVTRRLRDGERVGRTVVLRLRFGDYTRATRSHTLPRPTAETSTVLATVRALVARAEPLIDERGLTLVGIAVANLDDDDAVQLELPFDRGGAGALDTALDDVRTRFGTAAVTRAVLLGRDDGHERAPAPRRAARHRTDERPTTIGAGAALGSAGWDGGVERPVGSGYRRARPVRPRRRPSGCTASSRR